MSRIQSVFQSGKKVLNVYCTAGFPELNSTLPVMEALQENGADIIELGMPYSDPLADGPVIQESGSRALANGMTIKVLFEQLKDMRSRIRIPVVLMGYLNPVLQYGFRRFCENAAKVGVDGLILPDLPILEFEREYRAILEEFGLDLIFLVTPETSEERIRRIDSLSSGFLYAVSSSSTTGSDKSFADVDAYLARLSAMKLKNPILVGFGIRDRESFQTATKHTSGAIIGTAYIRALENNSDIAAATKLFLQGILE